MTISFNPFSIEQMKIIHEKKITKIEEAFEDLLQTTRPEIGLDPLCSVHKS